jgi:predicted RNA-binding Zn-ribbon protein involved in translation (DUF1610 family)
MSEPEISHRCTSCGASVRGHALFCPQCGHPFVRKDAKANKDGGRISPLGATESVETTPQTEPTKSTEPTSEVASPEPDRTPKVATTATTMATKPGAPVADRRAGRSTRGRERTGGSRSVAVNKARQRVQQATTAARDKLEDNVRPRVEKIRQASTVVLEEATYDPSVRFILVAAALFVLFVILLILSKVI